MKVIFAIPALSGTVHLQCMMSLMSAQRLLDLKGIEHEVFTIANCPVLTVARDSLVQMFMETDATDLFFIDSDVGFDADGVWKILQREEAVVAGIYPLKKDSGGFPVKIKTRDGRPLGRDGLIEAEFLPTGFMRIKRSVFESMAECYPDLRYEDSVIRVDDKSMAKASNFFGMGVYDGRFTTEDFAFCQRWRDIGGQLWVEPNINFQHVGQQAYAANYHEYLCALPGGVNESGLKLAKAFNTPGWMTEQELTYLAGAASCHYRIVEMGSAFGRSTRAIADNTVGIVVAIDDWYGPREEGIVEEERKAVAAGFKEFLGDLLDNGKVIQVEADHAEHSKFPPIRPDMVFIDGEHSYEAVKRDVAYWFERMPTGALICGHDFSWAGVNQAVNELLPQAKLVPGTDIWQYVKEEKPCVV